MNVCERLHLQLPLEKSGESGDRDDGKDQVRGARN